MSIEVYERSGVAQPRRGEIELGRRTRRGAVAAHDLRRPHAGNAEYGDVRAVRVRAGSEATQVRVQEPGVAATVAACLLAAMIVVGLFGLWNWRVGGPAAVESSATVQVQAGETLSDVAARVAPGVPVADVVGAIVELNDLSSPSVHAGQLLLAPAPGR